MTIISQTAGLDYLTADLPGIGGAIKLQPEDFIVEEQPLYLPCGSGEHLYIYIEKKERATTDVARRLAKVFNVSKSDVGYAGLKDKHAVTRQLFSVRLPDSSADTELLPKLEYSNIKALWSNRHANKLRRGHLQSNKFVIRIRHVDPSALPRVRQVLDRLANQGVPNFVGDQRFGYRQNNHELGKMLLLGQWQEFLDSLLGDPIPEDAPAMQASRQAYQNRDYKLALEHWPRHLRHGRQALDLLRQGRSPQEVVVALDYQQREFLVNALQSAIFNRALEWRLRNNLFDQLVEGDLAWKHDSGAVFLADHATAQIENHDTGRVRSMAVSPSGPIWGMRMLKPLGDPAAWELKALDEFGLTETALEGGAHAVAEGSRRSFRTIIKNHEVSDGLDTLGPFIQVTFELPKGSYATIVLREIMKPAVGFDPQLGLEQEAV